LCGCCLCTVTLATLYVWVDLQRCVDLFTFGCCWLVTPHGWYICCWLTRLVVVWFDFTFICIAPTVKLLHFGLRLCGCLFGYVGRLAPFFPGYYPRWLGCYVVVTFVVGYVHGWLFTVWLLLRLFPVVVISRLLPVWFVIYVGWLPGSSWRLAFARVGGLVGWLSSC